MVRCRVFGLLIVALGAASALTRPSFAQIPTGTVSGRVVAGGAVVQAVKVTAQSSALQGVRSTSTTVSGDYILPHLPPGEYTVTFSYDGLRTLEQRLKVSAAQPVWLDAEMVPATVAGEVSVSASFETISASTTAAATYESSLIDILPMPRTYDATVLLAPGTNLGLNDRITISGGVSSENLLTINGVPAMDNLYGNVHDYYIEDAIEETTVQSSTISAEYGRFTGGVVNMITKAGSNEFHGSYRLSLSNDDWVAETPVSPDRRDELGTIHELTFGGPIWQDRIWFFLAGRADPGQGRVGTRPFSPISRSPKHHRGSLGGQGHHQPAPEPPNHRVVH